MPATFPTPSVLGHPFLCSFDGFADLTGGVFQTCSITGACVSDTGSFAVDILGVPLTPVPDPSSVLLVGAALATLLCKRFFSPEQFFSPKQKENS